MELRPYQVDAVTAIRESIRQRHRCVLYVLPTGGGKTQIFTYIVRNAAAKNNRIACIVHRKELVDQISKRLECPHGINLSNNEPVQVCTVQTLSRRTYAPFQMLVIDEAHHVRATQYMSIIERNAGCFVLGVTATPQRLDGKGLRPPFQQLLIGPNAQWLTDNGYLAPFKAYTPGMPIDTSTVKTQLGDYHLGQLQEVVDKPSITGDAVKHYLKFANGKRALAACVSRAHAANVAAMFMANGIPAKAVDGLTPKPEREQSLIDLANGDLLVLSYCELFSEGVDVPAVECGIMLRPTQSLVMHLQQIGRILRPGKPHAIILDHAGNCLRLGFPTDERPWSLDGIRKRKKSDEPPCKQCPACFTLVHTALRECPECGHVFEGKPREINEVDGELTEYKKPATKEERVCEEKACQTYGELVVLGKKRGYKRGWAWHVWRERVRRAQARMDQAQ